MTDLPTTVPGTEHWRSLICCQAACPVHTDARGYVQAVARGEEELAYLIARGPNPLASICGRVCGAPCETACRRGVIDQPVAIRALKRYVCQRFGPDVRPHGSGSLVRYLEEVARRHSPRQCQGREELLPLLQGLLKGDFPKVSGLSVGIIGSGPAGLAAAHDLALMGFSVTLYEMEPVLAGMLATGIPEYRLPRDLIRAEVEVITSLGVEAVTSCCVGRDVTFGELRAKHDAVVVAVGYKRSRQLSIPGGDAEGILGGVEFLRAVALGKPPPLGERVLVIGGGNVAYDVGRTVLRQIAVDAARSARRAAGVAEVHLCSLESLEEMPADDIEIIEGDEEGILRHNSLGPQDFKVDERGRVRGVRFQRCLRVFDEERRFRPLFDADDVTELPCDTALVAIGQVFDISFIDPERDGIRLRPTGLIDSDPETGETSAGDVFVAGDLVHGPKLLIHAVASGKAVARAIYRRLTGRRIHMEAADLHLPLAEYRRVPDFEKRRRLRPEALPVAERLEGQQREVEKGFTREQAHYEASRCLDCAVNTIFDGSRCILCGGCAEVCPEQCLRLVGVEECFQGEELRALLERQAGGIPPGDATVIVKDETRCIRCALCAERCPTGAITMERFLYQERFLCHVG